LPRNLTLDEVKRILGEAQKVSLRDALVFRIMAGYGLSVGEIVGTPARQWDRQNKKWFPREPSLEGLQIQDLTEDGILVRRKMGRPTQTVPLNLELLRELREFIGKRTKGKIFEISESRVEQLAREHAQRAGIIEGNFRPQMFIDFYARHEGILPDALSQVSVAKTERKTMPVTINAHAMAQAALLELGNILGYDTYTSDPRKDPGKQFYEVVEVEGKKTAYPRTLGQIATLEEVPDFAPKRILDSVKKIDVIWFDKDGFPTFCFEVEHTTNVREGLLRQFQISRHVPNARFFIVAPEEQRGKFEKEVATYPFKQLQNRYVFKAYEDLVEFYDEAWRFHDLKSKFQL